jgi:negative regulator of flagellin synthesis FlgM
VVSSKISGIDGAQIARVGGSRATQRPQDTVTGASNSGAPDQATTQDVQITGTARNLSDLEQKLRDLPAVSEERVSQLSAAIEQGTYTVRPQHIADQLLSFERSLSYLQDAEEPVTEK